MDTQKVGELLDSIIDQIEGLEWLDFFVCDNWHANLIASANEIQEILRTHDKDGNEYTPVIRLARTEVEMLGGDPDEIDYIAEKTQDALMGLGYWDVVKTVILESQLENQETL